MKGPPVSVPSIKHKDEAMRVLGMGSITTDMGTKPMPLSKYTKHDIVDAYQRKISDERSKTKTKLAVHESFQVFFICFHVHFWNIFIVKVVCRVKNAKNRFRALGKGAATSCKVGGILAKLKQQQNIEGYNNNTNNNDVQKRVVINVVETKVQDLPPVEVVEKKPPTIAATNVFKSFW